jgi:tRNA pseudouridine38-40 synthase
VRTPKQRFRGVLAYDGTRFAGYQRQAAGTLTIQGVVEEVVTRILGVPTTIMASGRTDTGVHARGQVIAFDGEWRHPTESLWRAINAYLPPDVILNSLAVTKDDFHPRYDAVSRRYIYQCYTAPLRDPLRDHYHWYAGKSINLEAMQTAANCLIGTHDFASFGWPTHGDSTIRTLTRAEAQPLEDGHFRLIFEANAYLMRMIRNMVGTLAEVGRGKLTPQDLADILAATDRRWATTAPPHGLILDHVSYEEE